MAGKETVNPLNPDRETKCMDSSKLLFQFSTVFSARKIFIDLLGQCYMKQYNTYYGLNNNIICI